MASFAASGGRDGGPGQQGDGDEQHALVLLDIVLPGIDGFEVLRRIREQSSIPVIHMSGTHAEEVDRSRGLNDSADLNGVRFARPQTINAKLALLSSGFEGLLTRKPE